MEAETMTKLERKEFKTLSDEEDRLRNERVKLLIELVQIRNIPFTQLMKELGLNQIPQ